MYIPQGMDDERAVSMAGVFSELANAASVFCSKSKSWDPHGEDENEV